MLGKAFGGYVNRLRSGRLMMHSHQTLNHLMLPWPETASWSLLVAQLAVERSGAIVMGSVLGLHVLLLCYFFCDLMFMLYCMLCVFCFYRVWSLSCDLCWIACSFFLTNWPWTIRWLARSRLINTTSHRCLRATLFIQGAEVKKGETGRGNTERTPEQQDDGRREHWTWRTVDTKDPWEQSVGCKRGRGRLPSLAGVEVGL